MSEFELENKSEMIYINEAEKQRQLKISKYVKYLEQQIETKNKYSKIFIHPNNENIDKPHITPYTTKKPFIVKQDPVTGDWNTTIVKVEENNNEIKPEDDDIQESENADETDECDTDEHKNSDNKFLSCEKFQHITHMFIILVGYIYFFYCVWNLQNTFNTASTGVIFNDIYSGVNYHTIQN